MGDSDDDEAEGDGNGGDLEDWQQLPPDAPKEARTDLIRARLCLTFLLVQVRTKQGELLAHKVFSLADAEVLSAFFLLGAGGVELTTSERIATETEEDQFRWKQTLYLIEVGPQGGGGGRGCRVAKVMEKQNRPMRKPSGECEWFSCVGDDRLFRPTPAPAGQLYQNDICLDAVRGPFHGVNEGTPVVRWTLRLSFDACKIDYNGWKNKVGTSDIHRLYRNIVASVKNVKEWA